MWFPNARLNYVEQVFRHATPTRGRPIVAGDETGRIDELGLGRAARGASGRCAHTLRNAGVGRGDRVAAYLPNTPDAVVAFLATASLGAVWSLCSTDMGVASVVDRFRQIEPKVLIATDGYRFGGRVFDRRDVVAALRAAAAERRSVFIRVPSADVPRLAVGDATRLGRRHRGRRAARASSRCPSTIRSGSSIRRARPDCRSRSCTATAASCSSI